VNDDLSFLSFGKLRSSYGITGSDQIGDYQYLDSWSSTVNPYQGTSGLYPTRLLNTDYSWETNRKLAIGLDLGFLKDRILISGDYYYNRSSNHLLSYSLPSQTGFTSILENLPATIQNNGWEFSVNTKNINSDKFKWQTTFNLTIPSNKLVSFPGIATSSYAGTYTVGQSLNTRRGLEYTGVDPTTGVVTFKDQNGDGIINSSDVVNIGNLDPKFYGGLQNTFSYKSLSLNVFFQFAKQLGENDFEDIYANIPGSLTNLPATVLNRWQKPGDHSLIQMATANPGTAAYNAASLFTEYSNSAEISDASYIRFKNVSLSYNLPKKWLQRLNISNIRFYILGQNLLTITKYKDGDPETQSYYTIPPLRTLTAGFQITL